MTTRLFVSLGISEEEAVRQLEGGNSVRVVGLRTITIVPATNNVSTAEWMFRLYINEVKDLILECDRPQTAVQRAVEHAAQLIP